LVSSGGFSFGATPIQINYGLARQC
jgi:hypothetical protein